MMFSTNKCYGKNKAIGLACRDGMFYVEFMGDNIIQVSFKQDKAKGFAPLRVVGDKEDGSRSVTITAESNNYKDGSD